jgi:hypothetical protein
LTSEAYGAKWLGELDQHASKTALGLLHDLTPEQINALRGLIKEYLD